MATFQYQLGDSVPAECRGGAIAVGNFDGVHLGHQALIAEVVRRARAMGGPAVVVTFDPHPTKLLRPESFQPLLTTPACRSEILHTVGADHVLILETTPALLSLRAAEFFDRIIVQGVQARAIVEGFNFAFGKNREGTLETLQELGEHAEIGVTLLPAVEINGKPASTSRVRGEVLAGRMDHVHELLGRSYRVQGKVVAGQRRGKSLGFPTANLDQIENLIPGNGVYAVRARVGERSWPAAANVGPNPTFGEDARKVEVHVIGFEGDLYEHTLAVDFVAKLRDTRPYSGVAELIRQIETDIRSAQEILKHHTV